MWIANLSDGTVVTEKEPLPNEPTSWQKLLQYCRETGLKVTGLRLTDNARTMVSAMPHKMCKGYFQAYEATRYLLNSEVERVKQGIGSVVGDLVFIVWIEPADNELTYVWSEVRSLEECKIHTTLS